METATISLPDGLLERARRRASAEGVTLDAIVADALRQAIDAPPPERPPRTSVSSVGLTNGFTWDRLVQQAEEREDLDRLRAAE